MEEGKVTKIMNVVVEAFWSVMHEFALTPEEAIALITAGTTAFVVNTCKSNFSNPGKAILGNCTIMCSAFMDAIQELDDETGEDRV